MALQILSVMLVYGELLGGMEMHALLAMVLVPIALDHLRTNAPIVLRPLIIIFHGLQNALDNALILLLRAQQPVMGILVHLHVPKTNMFIGITLALQLVLSLTKKASSLQSLKSANILALMLNIFIRMGLADMNVHTL